MGSHNIAPTPPFFLFPPLPRYYPEVRGEEEEEEEEERSLASSPERKLPIHHKKFFDPSPPLLFSPSRCSSGGGEGWKCVRGEGGDEMELDSKGGILYSGSSYSFLKGKGEYGRRVDSSPHSSSFLGGEEEKEEK